MAVSSSAHGPEGHFDLPRAGVGGQARHDHLRDPAAALAWLAPRHELAVPDDRPPGPDLAALREVRSAVDALRRRRRAAYRQITGRLLARARFRLSVDGALDADATGWTAVWIRLLVPLVALDARRSQLKQCANDQCGWLFIDRSASRRRQWCDPKVCGNRVKVRRHRARQRAREDHP